MDSRKKNPDVAFLQERWRNNVARLSSVFAGRRARLIILGVALLFGLWQLYAFVWVPLSAEAVLPVGVTAVKPELDVATLTKVREARTARLTHPPNLFSNVDQYFADSTQVSPTGPTPSPTPKP